MVLLRSISWFFLILLPLVSFSQVELVPSERQIFEISDDLASGEIYALPDLKLVDGHFLAISMKAIPEDFSKLKYRNSPNDPWQGFERDGHVSNEDHYFSSLMLIDSNQLSLQFFLTERLTSSLEIHVYNPGKSEEKNLTFSKLRSDKCDCVSIETIERDAWCSQCPQGGPTVNDAPGFIILHHSAGGNSSNDWAAVVRSIWDFHVNTRGWDDIGYNYLVDPIGRIYVGRGDDRIGAHFCGTNSGTIGICMMGTYSNTLPPADAVQSIESLMSWQSCLWEINPIDTQFHVSSEKLLPTITGHRQGCATECPGRELFNYLPVLRQSVESKLGQCDSGSMADIFLECRVIENYTGLLEWSPLPDGADSYSLQYRISGAEEWDFIPLDKEEVSRKVQLRSGRMYSFRIELEFPSGDKKVSNTVQLTSGNWSSELEFVKIYPNPANESLTVSMLNDQYGEMAYAIIDLRSNIIREGNVTKDSSLKEFMMQVWDLPEGAYILHLFHSGFEYNRKFIIQH